ncbi:MAG: hypothetical protein AAF647_12940 [Pseudomonadota bacterium]
MCFLQQERFSDTFPDRKTKTARRVAASPAALFQANMMMTMIVTPPVIKDSQRCSFSNLIAAFPSTRPEVDA